MKTVNAIIKFPPIGQSDIPALENTQLAFVSAKRDSLDDLCQLVLKLGDDAVYFSSDANNGEAFASKIALKEQYDLLSAEIQDLMSKGKAFTQTANAAIDTLNLQSANLSAGLTTIAGVANEASAKADDAMGVAQNAIAAINDSNARITSISNSLVTIAAVATGNVADISGIKTAMSGVEAGITYANARIDDIDDTLSIITGNVADNTSNISYNKASIDDITARLDGLDKALITVTASINTAIASVRSDFSDDIADVNGDIVTVRMSAAENTLRITQLTSSLATIAGIASANATGVTAVNSRVDQLGTSLDAVSASVSANTASIAGNKADISTLSTSLATIAGTVSSNSDDIADLKSTAQDLNQSVTAQFAQLAEITATLSGVTNSVATATSDISALKLDLYGDGANLGNFLSDNLLPSSTIDITPQTNTHRLVFSVSSLPATLVTYANAGLPGISTAQAAIDALLDKISGLEARIEALESA